MKVAKESDENLYQFIKNNKLARLMDVSILKLVYFLLLNDYLLLLFYFRLLLADLQIDELIRMTSHGFDGGIFNKNQTERKTKTVEDIRKMVAKFL